MILNVHKVMILKFQTRCEVDADSHEKRRSAAAGRIEDFLCGSAGIAPRCPPSSASLSKLRVLPVRVRDAGLAALLG
jgi:hypothetical protein